jgi:DNA-binding CsgD family transcriptional regulator
MKCSRCSKEITEDQSYVYQGKVMCEDCVMDVGLSLKECDPWASYVDTSARKRHGATGAAELTEAEIKVYDLVKAKGKATSQEIMEALSLSQEDLNSQLVTLMHAELVKEMGEAGNRYLVPIPVPRS